jgi:hypothetical protein
MATTRCATTWEKTAKFRHSQRHLLVAEVVTLLDIYLYKTAAES